ncbi:hypothetical protein RFI_31491, partial [Reticulomyxa filosa]
NNNNNNNGNEMNKPKKSNELNELNKLNESNNYNEWVPFTDNHNHPIVILRDHGDYRGARALIGGINNNLLFITYYPRNIRVFDLNIFQFIKHYTLPIDNYIQYHCFVSNSENGQAQEMMKINKQNQMWLFCDKTGLSIEYNEDNNTFQFHQLPVCNDITKFDGYAYVCVNDIILFFGGSNGSVILKSVYKYSIQENKWMTFQNTLRSPLEYCTAVLSEDNTYAHIIGGYDGEGDVLTHMKTKLSEWSSETGIELKVEEDDEEQENEEEEEKKKNQHLCTLFQTLKNLHTPLEEPQCAQHKYELIICGGFYERDCYSYHTLKNQYKFICEYPNDIILQGHCVVKLVDNNKDINQITLLSFGGKDKHTLVMKYVSVWSDDNNNNNNGNEMNKSKKFNEWIPFTDDHNNPIIIGRDNDDYQGVRAVIGGINNNFVFDLNTFQFIKHDTLPTENKTWYHCFVSNSENRQEPKIMKTNEKQSHEMLLFSFSTALSIKYDEDNSIFQFHQLPVYDDIAPFHKYAY